VTTSSGATSALSALLERYRAGLLRIVRLLGSGLLRYESEEDLVQGIHLHALRVAEHFQDQGEKAFRGWILRVARQYIAHRHRYWSALRRNPGEVRRLSTFASKGTALARHPVSPATGPVTSAARREEFALAVKAIAVLLPRDQRLVRWMCEGASVEEIASRLGLTVDAAARAKRRAVERLRAAFEALSRRAGIRSRLA
jgi:RNA polymerase sigma factor (sigma-70 family)